jgi:CheY-like chemotaxis protein
VTAYSGIEDKKRALDAGCDEFITKPIKKELLFEKLAKHGVVI